MAKAGEHEVRERIRAQAPRFYDWRAHVLVMSASWIATALVCALSIEGVEPLEWLWVPAGMGLSYSAEYAFHRWPFHLRWGGEAYRRHTVLHHNFFTYDRPTIDGPRDLWLVLLPPYALAVFWVIQIPILFAFHRFAGPNTPWLFVLGSLAVYYPFYEVPHFLSHVTIEGGRFDHPLFHAISRHHRLHHAPNLMQYNYSFGIPLLDRLLGTYTRDLTARPRSARSADQAVLTE